ncbi:MAG: hypothetical protein ABI624_01160 [Casimicrobiaceae bacterium]
MAPESNQRGIPLRQQDRHLDAELMAFAMELRGAVDHGPVRGDEAGVLARQQRRAVRRGLVNSCKGEKVCFWNPAWQV